MSSNLISAGNLSVGNTLTVAGSTILNTIDASTSINTNLLTTNQIKLNNIDLNTRLVGDEQQISSLNTQINTLSNSMITSSGTQTISGDKTFTSNTTFNNIQYNYNFKNLLNASTLTSTNLCWYKIGQITMSTSISSQKCCIILFGGSDTYQSSGSGNYQIYFTTIQNSNNIEIDGYFYGLTTNQYLKNVLINSSSDLKTFTIYLQLVYNTKFYFDTTVSGLNLSFTQSFLSYGINAPNGFYLLKAFYTDGVFHTGNLSIGSFNTDDIAISNYKSNGSIFFLNTVSCTSDLWANGYNTGDRFTTIENNVNRLNNYFYCDDNFNIDINTKHQTGLSIGVDNKESIKINYNSTVEIESTGVNSQTLSIHETSSNNSILLIPYVGLQSYNNVFRQGTAISTLNNAAINIGPYGNTFTNTGIVIDNNDILISSNHKYLYLNGSGIGVNKTNPTYPLDVNGNINCSDLITSSISSLNTAISTINTDLDNLSNTDTSHTNSINSLNTSIANLTNSINGLTQSISILQNVSVKAYGYWSGSLGSNSLTTNYNVNSAFFNTQYGQTGVQIVLSSSISNLKYNISVTCDSDGNNATAHILSYNPFTFIVACYGGNGNAQLVNGVRNQSLFFSVI